jgi:hypothetical protein
MGVPLNPGDATSWGRHAQCHDPGIALLRGTPIRRCALPSPAERGKVGKASGVDQSKSAANAVRTASGITAM